MDSRYDDAVTKVYVVLLDSEISPRLWPRLLADVFGVALAQINKGDRLSISDSIAALDASNYVTQVAQAFATVKEETDEAR